MGRQVKDNGQTTGSTVITGYKVSRKLCIAMDTHWPDDWVASTCRVDLTKWPVSVCVSLCTKGGVSMSAFQHFSHQLPHCLNNMDLL